MVQSLLAGDDTQLYTVMVIPAAVVGKEDTTESRSKYAVGTSSTRKRLVQRAAGKGGTGGLSETGMATSGASWSVGTAEPTILAVSADADGLAGLIRRTSNSGGRGSLDVAGISKRPRRRLAVGRMPGDRKEPAPR